MRSILSVTLAMLVLLVVVLDGASMWAAYQTAEDVAHASAQKAAFAYVSSNGDQLVADRAARAYAAENEAELVQVEYHQSDYRWYEAKVRVAPSTRVFQMVPGLKGYLEREAEAVVNF